VLCIQGLEEEIPARSNQPTLFYLLFDQMIILKENQEMAMRILCKLPNP
jgi:hypothetical protein